MMWSLYITVLLCVVATTAISRQRLYHQEWRAYKLEYQKRYTSIEEDRVHMKAFLESKLAIARHEQLYARGLASFRLGLNKYADVPRDEFLRTMNGYKMTQNKDKEFAVPKNISLAEVPASVDWRQAGYVTAVKDQQRCASCWAFSATGALEAQVFRKRDGLVSLSEQNLIDCSREYGNSGCEGGSMDLAFRYVRDVGIDSEGAYPYEAIDDSCRYKANDSITREHSFKYVPSGDEAKLMVTVAVWGPVSAAIDASMHSFHLYRDGVYYDRGCSSTNLNHAVLVVGYGHDPWRGDYWLVKNSWGASWGEGGYVKIARNFGNHCGIATVASYPMV